MTNKHRLERRDLDGIAIHTDILTGDALDQLQQLPDNSVHCVITSPPYWNLRDYQTGRWVGGDAGCDHSKAKIKGRAEYGGVIKMFERVVKTAGFSCYQKECPCGAVRVDQQIGLETSISEYVDKLVTVFREVKRVLRPDGTAWINIGDSYGGSSKGPSKLGSKQRTNAGSIEAPTTPNLRHVGIKPKDMCLVPFELAKALRDDGWYVRDTIIWSKRNPMPISVADRCTPSYEFIFMLSTKPRYYYDQDAIREDGTIPEGTCAAKGGAERSTTPGVNSKPPEYKIYTGTRNKRSVWETTIQPFPGAHFATFPEDAITPCILAGTSEKGCCPKCGAPWKRITKPVDKVSHDGDTKSAFPTELNANRLAKLRQAAREQGADYHPGRITTGWKPTCSCPHHEPIPCIVLDPFFGSGTTAVVANRLKRNAIGIELSPKYVELARRRIRCSAPLYVDKK